MRARAGLLALVTVLAGCGAISTPVAPSSAASAVVWSPDPAASVGAAAPLVAGAPEAVVERRPLAPPAQPSVGVRLAAALVEDPCTDRELPAPPAHDVALTVLDRSYALPPTYEPADLVPAANAGLTGGSGTKLVRAVVIDDLAAMRQAWEAAGLSVAVSSAYRSYATQASTFDSWAARLEAEAALLRSARPGHSEHQLGTAIDVTSPGWDGRFGDWAVETAEGRWMADGAWRYGFVMSYPAGAQPQTCFGYEPWHYRWIGRAVAAEHRESGLPLRVFLERYVGD